MPTMRRKHFTLLEMMVVLAIIAVLLGMSVVAFNLAKQKARFVRWQAYNEMFNRDPSTVLNFNFTDMTFKQRQGSVYLPALYNGATGCTVSGFEPDDYHGLITKANWIRGGGRTRYHHALQFDGSNSFVEIVGKQAVDADLSADDLTILMWVRFDSLSSTRVLCAKAEWTKVAQYDIYLYKNSLEVDAGRVLKGWQSPVIKTGKWYQLAVVVENLGMTVSPATTDKKGKVTPGKTTYLQSVQAYLNGVPMTKEKASGLVSPGSTTPRSLLLGGVWTTGGSKVPRYLFQGRMDEFVLIRRALSAKEIANHYQMGKD